MGRTRLAAVALAATLAAPARGQDPPQPLRYDVAADLAVTGAAALTWATLGLLSHELAPLDCKWCQPPPLDEKVQAALVWKDPQTAATLSDVTAAALPAGLLAFGYFSARGAGDKDAFWVDTLVIAEAVSIAGALNVSVKYLAGRQRPYAYYGRQPSYDDPYDRNVSFYSGHVSMTFASAAAAGTVYLMRGYKGAPWVLGGGLALAAFTGYLRIGADKHWFTDVMVGAAVGGLVGWAVPYLFHRGGSSGSQGAALMPAPGGIAIAF
ncbi:MAG TPA: phosphatase PAP2 family protein [Anaeromyxobacteraceae bacterium]|nr:phosphatase PAP2 family protein [Anaeromyxobacteraceae bacterium]